MPVLRIERPHIVWRCDVQDAVHREDRTLYSGRTDELVVADTAADDFRRARTKRHGHDGATGTSGEPDRPGQGQVLYVGLCDLRERAVSAAGVIAGVSRPRIAQWLEDVGGIESCLLRGEQ